MQSYYVLVTPIMSDVVVSILELLFYNASPIKAGCYFPVDMTRTVEMVFCFSFLFIFIPEKYCRQSLIIELSCY